MNGLVEATIFITRSGNVTIGRAFDRFGLTCRKLDIGLSTLKLHVSYGRIVMHKKSKIFTRDSKRNESLLIRLYVYYMCKTGPMCY